jgi:hypothetical protein
MHSGARIAVVLALVSCSAPNRASADRDAAASTAASQSRPNSAAPSPASLAGEYVGAGCPSGRSADCLRTTAQDRLTIRRRDEQYEVEIRLVFQGQSCYMKAPASWDAARFVVRADGLEVDKPCELRLSAAAGIVTVADVENRCRQVYCGARGSLTGARFKKR